MVDAVAPLASDVASAPDAGSRALWFALSEETGELQVNFDPNGNRPPNMSMVKQALADANLGLVHLDDAALGEFVTHARSTKDILIWVIGKCRDAELSMRVSDDRMTAWLTLIPAEGGERISLVVLNGLLRANNISHGILQHEIDAALACGACEDLVIARGDPPVEGVPARFESLLDAKQHALSHVDESAVVKYRDLSHLLLVQPGDRLMRRFPPVQGTNGIDITGQVAFAKPLPDLLFGDDFPGAAPDPHDPDLLLAVIDGQPSLIRHGVTVNPVIEVPGVDLSTGSIKFEGTIHVNGDVISGMRIEVTGDVIIRGTLEAAEVIAGGNVAVEGGIIGHADARPGAHVLPADTARIRCKGSLQALFIENAHVEAGDSIFVERSTRQCELIALNDIVVGKNGSKVSQIVGGVSQAKHLIKALVLGSAAGVKTRIQIGFDPFVDEQIASNERQMQKKVEELDQLQKLVAFFKLNPKKGAGGIAEKVEATRRQTMFDINKHMVAAAKLAEQGGVDEDARVEISKTVHYGVEVKIGKQTWQATDDMPGTAIGLQEGRIAIGLPPVKEVQEATMKPTPGSPKFG
jgi:hypothetical protein